MCVKERVCVCVRERERERGERAAFVCIYVLACCVLYFVRRSVLTDAGQCRESYNAAVRVGIRERGREREREKERERDR